MALRVGSPGALLHPGLRAVGRQEPWGSGPVTGRWKEVTEVGPRVQEGEGACPGWERRRPELPGGRVGKSLLGLELRGTGRRHGAGGPRRTRPNCARVNGEQRKTPCGEAEEEGAPQRPSPGLRRSLRAQSPSVWSRRPWAVSAPGPALATCEQVGYGERRVPQSWLFDGRSDPAHRAWTHVARSIPGWSSLRRASERDSQGREVLQDPNIFLGRKSGSADPTVAQAESWDPVTLL